VVIVGFSAVFFLTAALTATYMLYQHFSENLPEIGLLKSYQPSLITTLYADDGTLVGQFFVERRILVPLERIPAPLKQATIAVEDARFYAHPGIDVIGIARAVWTNLQSGTVVEGASTITQQVAKLLFLTHRKTLERKLREVLLAVRMERTLSKDEILEIYLNQAYYGHSAYGVEAAANVYFGKHVEELTLPEAALLAGLPKAPIAYSPYTAPERALRRRAHVLTRMVETHDITPEDAQRALETPLRLRMRQEPTLKAAYFVEHVRRYLEEQYGSAMLYRGGLRVHTTLDLSMQEAAESALRNGVTKNDRRRGYRGPLGHLELTRSDHVDWAQVRQVPWPEEHSEATTRARRVKAIVVGLDDKRAWARWETGEGTIPLEAMLWAYAPNPDQDAEGRRLRWPGEALKVGDVVLADITQPGDQGKKAQLALAQEPVVQGALVALEPSTGYIRALVGGYEFGRSQFNRATQAIRQPGSAFKPIIYAAAIHKGYSPAHVIVDAPFVRELPDGKVWKPSNYDGKFLGPLTLAEALAHSRNVITVKLLLEIGIKNAIEYAKGLGIKSPLAPTPALALGASGLTPLELTAAYSVFANQGVRQEPLAVKRVEDWEGHVLEEHASEGERVISEQEAFVVTSMLQGVVQRGTGTKAKALGRPLAGKTGTTNDFIDAWFVGYSPNLVAGVWVGIDDREPLGSKEQGSRAALPTWIEFMQQALERTPRQDFVIPSHVRMVRVHPRTGASGDAAAGETIPVAMLEGVAAQARQVPQPPPGEPASASTAAIPPRWRDLGLRGSDEVPSSPPEAFTRP
jgi:penicillin-binding protein 1A